MHWTDRLSGPRRRARASMSMQIDLHNCTLRRWRPGDEASLVLHANNREVWLNLRDQFPYPYTSADAESWVALAASQGLPTAFAIEVDSEAVGGVGFSLQGDIERVSAEIGYWLGQRLWNRGIMTAAVLYAGRAPATERDKRWRSPRSSVVCDHGRRPGS